MSEPSAPRAEGISVTLLTKNNAPILEDCLRSLEPFLRRDLGDEILVLDTGSTDNTADIAAAAGCRVLSRPDLCVAGMHDLVQKYLPDKAGKLLEDSQFKDGFLSDFAAARQIVTDAAANDLVFWIDSDDVLEGGAELREFCRDFFRDPKKNALFLAYDYSFDADGTCTTILWRERILRRSAHKWVGVCHESALPLDKTNLVAHRVDLAKIIHKHGRAHVYSDIRNYAILRRAHDSDAWKDPRHEFYLGNACRGLSMWQEAIEWYTRVLMRSGSRDDRLAAALNIAYTHVLYGRSWRAIDWFNTALKIDAHDPRAYFGIARAYFELKQWNNTVLWTELGRSIGKQPSLAAVDPNTYDYFPLAYEALAFKELGNVSAAQGVLVEVQRLRPNFEATKDLTRDIQGWAQREGLKNSILSVSNLAFSRDGALDIIKSVKPEIRKLIPDLQVESYAANSDKHITYLCGKTHEAWDPTSEQDGIGGSEKMVILLAREWAKLGYRVDVYGSPKPENAYKTFDGVTYRPAESFNPDFERNILIIWRNWGFLDFALKAKKIFIDLHDVQFPAAYTPERLAKLSGCFFKSAYHAEPVKHLVPPEKLILSRNGISPERFLKPLAVARSYKRFCFISAGDRGLKRALRIFGRLKAIDPEVSMWVAYGFTPLYLKHAAEAQYQHFGDEGCDRCMLDYAEECRDLAARHGVEMIGRVGHQEIADRLRLSSAVIYPTHFPEISCMAMQEAQAAGCLPICSQMGALPETVQWGTTFPVTAPDDVYLSALADIVAKGPDLDTYRSDASRAALAVFDIAPLAAAWLERFNA